MASIGVAEETDPKTGKEQWQDDHPDRHGCCWTFATIVGTVVAVACGLPISIVFGGYVGVPFGLFCGCLVTSIILLLSMLTHRADICSMKKCFAWWFIWICSTSVLIYFYLSTTGCVEFEVVPTGFSFSTAALTTDRLEVKFKFKLTIDNPNYLEINAEGVAIDLYYMPADGSDNQLVATAPMDNLAVEINSVHRSNQEFIFNDKDASGPTKYAVDCAGKTLVDGIEVKFCIQPVLTIGTEVFTSPACIEFPLVCLGADRVFDDQSVGWPTQPDTATRVPEGCEISE